MYIYNIIGVFFIHQPTSQEPKRPYFTPNRLAGRLRGRARLDFGTGQLLLGREAEGVLVHLARPRRGTQVGHGENGGKYGMDIRCLVIQTKIKSEINNIYQRHVCEIKIWNELRWHNKTIACKYSLCMKGKALFPDLSRLFNKLLYSCIFLFDSETG